MKYVRTKDGMIVNIFGWRETDCYFENETNILAKSRILKQSNNIEELCDGFVVISEEYDEPHYVKKLIDTNALDFKNNWKPYGNGKVLDQTCQKLIDAIIYGAIWTKAGLIYVATMNEQGELVLL